MKIPKSIPKSAETGKASRFWSRLSKTSLLMISTVVVTSIFFTQSSFEFFPPSSPLSIPVTGSNLQTHYLTDLEYSIDEKNGFGRIPHLSVFNPGTNEVQLDITVYYQNREPNSFQIVVPAQMSSESSAEQWPVPLNSRFALKIESTQPIIVQTTQGWNNTSNDYLLSSSTANSNPRRETAKSYMSIASLAKECYIADGIILDASDTIWIKETEDTVVLNPNKDDLTITMHIYFGHRTVTRLELPADIPVINKEFHIPAERVAMISMTEWLKANWHYGARITGDQPFAAQWLRMVYWYDSPELMSEWSVPCVQVE